MSGNIIYFDVNMCFPNSNWLLYRTLYYLISIRDFLRMGHPLCCKPFDSWKSEALDSNGNSSWPANKHEGGPVPLTRVKTLVSMTTPRDFRVNGASLIPPFVEFDMSSEGFGCLYLPSIAPQSACGPSVVGVGMVGGSDTSVLGGIGNGSYIS